MSNLKGYVKRNGKENSVKLIVNEELSEVIIITKGFSQGNTSNPSYLQW